MHVQYVHHIARGVALGQPNRFGALLGPTSPMELINKKGISLHNPVFHRAAKTPGSLALAGAPASGPPIPGPAGRGQPAVGWRLVLPRRCIAASNRGLSSVGGGCHYKPVEASMGTRFTSLFTSRVLEVSRRQSSSVQ